MSATINLYKTENQILQDFILLANNALAFFSIQGWQVRQLRQVLKVNVLPPTIFVSIITNKQTGAQYSSSTKINNVITETKSAKQEVKIRFSAANKRKITDDTSTFYGVDVLKLISYYLQSQTGINDLKNLGYAQYRNGLITNQDFLDDSENFKFMPFFENEYLYTNQWSSPINQINEFNSQVYKF